jgi:ABC-2 type transport system ATP-binding protein
MNATHGRSTERARQAPPVPGAGLDSPAGDTAPAAGAAATSVTSTAVVAELRQAGVRDRLAPIDLRIGTGVTALVGGNGSGKSTVLALLAGRLPPTSGRVLVGGAPATSAAAALQRADVPQRVSFPGRARVIELLAVARAARGVSAEAAAAAVAHLGMERLLHRAAGQLSGGERQRIALAAALMGTPRLWLLDEPAAALDRGGLAHLAAWVREHAAAGGSVVVSVHRDEEMAAYEPQHVVRLERGQLVADVVGAD